jgi:uncharacterized membrane protein
MKTKYLFINVAIIISTVIVAITVGARLSDQLAIHWNFSGEVDRYASKNVALFSIPLIMVVIFLLSVLFTRLKSFKSQVESFSETYWHSITAIMVLFAYTHIVLIFANLYEDFNLPKQLIGGLALFSIFIGNAMPKIRKNHIMGIRTPWTLADESVWFHTHRFAGKSVVSMALLVFVGIFLGLKISIGIVLLLVSFLAPAVYSYVVYKRVV